MSAQPGAALNAEQRPHRMPGLFGMLARRLCYAWQGRLPTRHISHMGAPYMERSYVATLFGVRIYLHRFVACDEDGVHDHPFRHSMSLILAGWYWEDQWASRRRQRWFNFIGPNKLHRVVLPESAGADVWTLFLHTPRVKPWGAVRAVEQGRHGPVLRYEPQSEPTDPSHSSWHLRAPTGRALRADPSRNIAGPAFDIPLGMNAYSAGLARYPDSARQHALQSRPDATIPGATSTRGPSTGATSPRSTSPGSTSR